MSHEPGTGGLPGLKPPEVGQGRRRAAWRRFSRNRLAVLGAAVVLVFGFIAIFAPLLAPESPTRQNFDAILASPGLEHPMGTDRLGRDTLSRLMHGARTSMAVGIVAQLIVLSVGIPVGLIAGAAGSRLDNLVMRGVDIVYAFPDLLMIILLRAVFGGSLYMMFLAVGLASWPTIARLVRGQVLSLKERDFVMAARAAGVSGPRLAIRHLLPNALGPVVVASTFLVPRAIFAEAALSYIGIGVSPPTPTWGAMVQEGYAVVFVASEQVLFPTVAIALLMMAFTFLGNGLRDLLDPRTT